MGRIKQKQHMKPRHRGGAAHSCGGAGVRPMQGMDMKSFRLNDIEPIVLNNPGNSTKYTVTVIADVNGWTWEVAGATGNVV